MYPSSFETTCATVAVNGLRGISGRVCRSSALGPRIELLAFVFGRTWVDATREFG